MKLLKKGIARLISILLSRDVVLVFIDEYSLGSSMLQSYNWIKREVKV
jgi:hypothetical protein